MGNPVETATVMAKRAEQMIRERLARDVVPAEEATLTSLMVSPRATIALSEDQKRQLAAIEQPSVTA